MKEEEMMLQQEVLEYKSKIDVMAQDAASFKRQIAVLTDSLELVETDKTVALDECERLHRLMKNHGDKERDLRKELQVLSSKLSSAEAGQNFLDISLSQAERQVAKVTMREGSILAALRGIHRCDSVQSLALWVSLHLCSIMGAHGAVLFTLDENETMFQRWHSEMHGQNQQRNGREEDDSGTENGDHGGASLPQMVSSPAFNAASVSTGSTGEGLVRKCLRTAAVVRENGISSNECSFRAKIDGIAGLSKITSAISCPLRLNDGPICGAIHLVRSSTAASAAAAAKGRLIRGAIFAFIPNLSLWKILATYMCLGPHPPFSLHIGDASKEMEESQYSPTAFEEGDELILESLSGAIASVLGRCQAERFLRERTREKEAASQALRLEKDFGNQVEEIHRESDMRSLTQKVTRLACRKLQAKRAYLYLLPNETRVENLHGWLSGEKKNSPSSPRRGAGRTSSAECFPLLGAVECLPTIGSTTLSSYRYNEIDTSAVPVVKCSERQDGIVGLVAASATGVCITDAGTSALFERVSEDDVRMQYRTSSALCSPIIMHGRGRQDGAVVGVLHVVNHIAGGESFSENDLKVLDSICAHAASAITFCDSVRLLSTSSARERRLYDRLRIIRTLSSICKWDNLFSCADTITKATPRVEKAAVLVLDALGETKELYHKDVRVPVETSEIGQVILSGKTLVLGDGRSLESKAVDTIAGERLTSTCKSIFGFSGELSRHLFAQDATFLCIPLNETKGSQEGTVGVLLLVGRGLGEEALSLGSEMATALHRAVLSCQAQSTITEGSTSARIDVFSEGVYDLHTRVHSQSFISHVGEVAARICNAKQGDFYVLDKDLECLLCPHVPGDFQNSRRVALDDKDPLADSVRRGRVVVGRERSGEYAASALRHGAGPFLCVPVFGADGEAIGALELVDLIGRPMFAENDIKCVELLSRHVSLALRSWCSTAISRRVQASLLRKRSELTQELRLVRGFASWTRIMDASRCKEALSRCDALSAEVNSGLYHLKMDGEINGAITQLACFQKSNTFALFALVDEVLTKLLRCEYAALFVSDQSRQLFWHLSRNSGVEVAVPFEEGSMLKTVIDHGKPVFGSGSGDERTFDFQLDMQMGHQTKNALCIAVNDDSTGSVLGVIQIGNRGGADFEDRDVGVFKKVEKALVAAVRNTFWRCSLNLLSKMGMRRESGSLLQPATFRESISAGWSKEISSLLCGAFGADRADIIYADVDSNGVGAQQLWTHEMDGRVSLVNGSAGVIGHTIAKRAPMSIAKLQEHPLYDESVDRRGGSLSKSAIFCPIITSAKKILGVVQLGSAREAVFDTRALSKCEELAIMVQAQLQRVLQAIDSHQEAYLYSLRHSAATVMRALRQRRVSLRALAWQRWREYVIYDQKLDDDHAALSEAQAAKKQIKRLQFEAEVSTFASFIPVLMRDDQNALFRQIQGVFNSVGDDINVDLFVYDQTRCVLFFVFCS